jgi:hypothetical protein
MSATPSSSYGIAAGCSFLGLCSCLLAAVPWLPVTEDWLGMHFIDDGMPCFIASLVAAVIGLASSVTFRNRHPAQAWLKLNYVASLLGLLASSLELYATFVVARS